MKIAIPNENHNGEPRTALIPANASRLTAKGIEICVESGLGTGIHETDAAYKAAGCTIADDRDTLFAQANLVLRVGCPTADDIERIPRGSIHVSFLDPFNETARIRDLAAREITTVSIEMIPRTTRAQKMDALSSQASLAGYNAVILAAERLDKIFPMMMTPAGTISPARVFIIGAGVAGLQAIATAKRLGARVDAFDTRPVVAEQVQSLGAKFVTIDLGDTGQTQDGYAKALTPEQLDLQRAGMAKVCSQSDVVITTAQVFGRPAPQILTAAMVRGMTPGSVVVDMAVASGGNVEGSECGKEVTIGGVTIVGIANLPGRTPVHASQMYSNNLYNFIDTFWNDDAGTLHLAAEDEIIRGCVITRDGNVVNEKIRAAIADLDSLA